LFVMRSAIFTDSVFYLDQNMINANARDTNIIGYAHNIRRKGRGDAGQRGKAIAIWTGDGECQNGTSSLYQEKAKAGVGGQHVKLKMVGVEESTENIPRARRAHHGCRSEWHAKAQVRVGGLEFLATKEGSLEQFDAICVEIQWPWLKMNKSLK